MTLGLGVSKMATAAMIKNNLFHHTFETKGL